MQFSIDEFDVDGPRAAEIAQQLGQKAVSERRQNADPETAFFGASDCRDVHSAFNEMLKCFSGSWQESLTGEGEADTSVVAVEKRCADPVLKFTDAAAECGLLDAENCVRLVKTSRERRSTAVTVP